MGKKETPRGGRGRRSDQKKPSKRGKEEGEKKIAVSKGNWTTPERENEKNPAEGGPESKNQRKHPVGNKKKKSCGCPGQPGGTNPSLIKLPESGYSSRWKKRENFLGEKEE